MNTTSKILSESPLIQFYENVFSKEICDQIIDWGKDKLMPGRIVSGSDGKDIVDTAYRDASIATYQNKSIPFYETICDTVSELIGASKDRFEPISLTHYTEGQKFKIHPDYFGHVENNPEHNKNVEKHCSKGGNRLETVIVYLNEVETGGETFFPWVDKGVIPKVGRVCHFKYDYDDPSFNVKSQHCALPVLKGEKWILTIWIREKPITEIVTDFRKFKIESKFNHEIKDVSYSLDCGPDWDKRTLTVNLPKNDSAMNGIAVAVTGGYESSLLLYLLAILNKYQKVPYHIQPIMIPSEVVDGIPIFREHYEAVNRIVEIINQKDVPKVRHLIGLLPETSQKNNSHASRVFHTLMKVFDQTPKEDTQVVHFTDFKYLYYGTNELPNDNDPRWAKIKFKRKPSKDSRVLQPFYNLQKYHIIDAMIQLELTELFEIIGPCSLGHTTLEEECIHFACEERRWGFYKLDRSDLGYKYLTTNGSSQ